MNTNVLGVIPARYASVRLPGKPLRDICGKSLIQRVWEQASRTSVLSHLVVATDSEEISTAAKAFGAEVIMTSNEISTGSARVYAAAKICGEKFFEKTQSIEQQSSQPETFWDAVVNIQGDMPFIRPEVIDQAVIFLLENHDQFEMTTIATPLTCEEHYLSSSVVKVVMGENCCALYFSRAPVPYSRDGDRLSNTLASETSGTLYGLKHIGLYVFRPEVLELYADSRLSMLESVEKLEQLRALERGYRIGVCVIPQSLTENSVEVDTPEDLRWACEIASRM